MATVGEFAITILTLSLTLSPRLIRWCGIWANQPIHSFLVGCLNPCLASIERVYGLVRPSRYFGSPVLLSYLHVKYYTICGFECHLPCFEANGNYVWVFVVWLVSLEAPLLSFLHVNYTIYGN